LQPAVDKVPREDGGNATEVCVIMQLSNKKRSFIL